MTRASSGSGTRVSVVVPVRDGESTIADAIGSVVSQSFADLELVVIDDGSGDRSAERVEELAGDRRIRLIRQTHAGLAAARNRGIEHARGELVAFLDADDLWPPGYLATMVEALAARPAAVLAFSSWQYVDQRGELLPQKVRPHGGSGVRAARELFWKNSIVPSGVIVRAAALERVGGFDPSFSRCEDWDLWLRLAPLGKFVAVPEATTLYRANANGLSEDPEAMERARWQVHEKHLGPAIGEPRGWPPALRRACGHTLFVSALALLRRGRDGEARAKLHAALALWPGLADQDELYFELACARQPRGLRGPSPALDLAASARLISWMLPESELPGLPAQGRLVLGKLALLAGARDAAREHALAALGGRGRCRWPALRLLASAALPRTLASRPGR